MSDWLQLLKGDLWWLNEVGAGRTKLGILEDEPMSAIENRLQLLPCLDSEEMASFRRRELMMPTYRAAELGRSAMVAGRQRSYLDGSGSSVDWSLHVEAARAAKRSIPPYEPLPPSRGYRFAETRIQVSNETTLAAARRMVERGQRPLALNFANGIHPGGGFLRGARAQEEVLCRSSALFETLEGDPMYAAHRQRPLPDSSKWAILSPEVPVFRNDDGSVLEQLWLLSFITCAAPYVPDVGQPRAGNLLRGRILRVLAIAQAYGYSALVLGAWGCGAFQNDTQRTAGDFRGALIGPFRGVFSDVCFAITDWSPERKFLGPFRDVFAPSNG